MPTLSAGRVLTHFLGICEQTFYVDGRKFFQESFVKFISLKKSTCRTLLKYGLNCINSIVEVSYKIFIPKIQ